MTHLRRSSSPHDPLLDAAEVAQWVDDPEEPATLPLPISKAGRYLATLTDAYGPLPASALAIDVPFVGTLALDASALTALAGGSLARIVVPATALRNAALARIADSLADVVAVDTAQARLAATLLVVAPAPINTTHSRSLP